MVSQGGRQREKVLYGIKAGGKSLLPALLRNDKDMEDVLRKNMESAIARYKLRYQNGHCTSEELQSLIAWEEKNYRSGGRLYAERLVKALTPNPKWYK